MQDDSSPPASNRRTVRSDARENRDRILEVARVALEESGDTSLNQIAQRANVGPGTLYRPFPTREAVVLAVYHLDVNRLAESAPDLLATRPPLEALRHWTGELVKYMRMKHGLGDAVSPSASQAVTEQSYGPVIAAIAQILAAGKHDGRPERVLSLILDGLRPQD
jgi:Bacterial regulatory proteins, tetR family